MTLSRSRVFRQCGASFLVGVFLSYFISLYFSSSFILWLRFLSLSILVFWVFIIGCFYIFKKKKTAFFLDFNNDYFSRLIILTLILLSALLGAYRCYSVLRQQQGTAIKTQEQIEIIAPIIREPVLRENYQQIIVPQLVIYTDKYPHYHYGDIVKIKGTVNPFERLRFYNSIIVSGKISYPSIELITPSGFSLRKVALLAKHKMTASLQKILPEPKAGFAVSLIFGSKNNLSNSLEQQIRKAGLSHIVVTSGLHLSIITKMISEFFNILCLSSQLNFIFSCLFLLMFAFMAGLTPSIIRASIMAFLLLLSRLNFRLYNSFNSLIFTAVIMVYLNPLILFWDLGFQFSFLSTAGIIFLYPLWSENSFWQQEWFNQRGRIIKQTVLSTFSALTFVVPWAIFKTQTFSLAAFFSNLLVLPFVPIIMLGIIATSVCSLLLYQLGLFFGFFLNLILSYFLKIIFIFSSLSWSQIYIPFTFRWFIFPYYIFLFLYLCRKNKI